MMTFSRIVFHRQIVEVTPEPLGYHLMGQGVNIEASSVKNELMQGLAAYGGDSKEASQADQGL